MGEFGPVGLLQFSVMAISLLFVVIFFIAWLNFGRKKHALIWSLAFFASALEWLLNLYVGDIVLMQGHLGALVSLLTISTVSLAFLGHRQRVGLSTNLGVLLSGGLLVEAAVVWFSLYEIHAGIRQSIVPGYGYFLLSWSAITIVIKSRERNPAVWGAGAAIM
ncbi:MAG: hypothetical protein OEZ23_10280, partial [Gammaproteobacteria bacterium]|nr:hypothetical protein [Gammaproteobacteria bacterium]